MPKSASPAAATPPAAQAAPAPDASAALASPDQEGRCAYVLAWGGQIAWLHDAEAPADDAGRRATLRDLAIAGQA